MIRLTHDEWTEIYYALQTKAHAIKNGDFGDPLELDEPSDANEKWINQLLEIMDKIGPDGDDAFKNGVQAN